MRMGSTPRYEVMMSENSFFIGTFSSRKRRFGLFCLAIFRIRTYSKNREDLGSLKLSCLPAKENPWQGDPPMRRSMWGGVIDLTSPRWMVLGKFFWAIFMA